MKRRDLGVCVEKPPTPGLYGHRVPSRSIASPFTTWK